MENVSMIGAKFKLLRPMLGAAEGEIGYVFNQYEDFDDETKLGVQIIFPNGEYDGFSAEEQELYLTYEGYDLRYVGYQFKHVMQVGRDYQNGFWKWN